MENSSNDKTDEGRCDICKAEIEEFNSGVEAWRAGVAFHDLPDMPMDQNGVGWAWAAWNGKAFVAPSHVGTQNSAAQVSLARGHDVRDVAGSLPVEPPQPASAGPFDKTYQEACPSCGSVTPSSSGSSDFVHVWRKSAEVAADVLEEFDNEVGDDVWVAAKHLREALVTPSANTRDTAMLDLIERTEAYPWKDYGGWKFRLDKQHFTAPTLREVMGQALVAAESRN